MIRTSLVHFQRLLCMGKACEEWEEYELEQDQLDEITTWKEFKTLFNRKFLIFENQQETLQEAGIAKSAIAKEEIENLFDERDSTVAALLAECDTKFDALSQKFEVLLASTNAN